MQVLRTILSISKFCISYAFSFGTHGAGLTGLTFGSVRSIWCLAIQIRQSAWWTYAEDLLPFNDVLLISFIWLAQISLFFPTILKGKVYRLSLLTMLILEVSWFSSLRVDESQQVIWRFGLYDDYFEFARERRYRFFYSVGVTGYSLFYICFAG